MVRFLAKFLKPKPKPIETVCGGLVLVQTRFETALLSIYIYICRCRTVWSISSGITSPFITTYFNEMPNTHAGGLRLAWWRRCGGGMAGAWLWDARSQKEVDMASSEE